MVIAIQYLNSISVHNLAVVILYKNISMRYISFAPPLFVPASLSWIALVDPISLNFG